MASVPIRPRGKDTRLFAISRATQMDGLASPAADECRSTPRRGGAKRRAAEWRGQPTIPTGQKS